MLLSGPILISHARISWKTCSYQMEDVSHTVQTMGENRITGNQAWGWQSTEFSRNWSDYMTLIKTAPIKNTSIDWVKSPTPRQKNGCRKQNRPYLSWHKVTINHCKQVQNSKAWIIVKVAHLTERYTDDRKISSTKHYAVHEINRLQRPKDAGNPNSFCFPQLTWSDPNSHARSLEGKKNGLITNQGLRATAIPTFELFSMVLVSTSAEMVTRDFGLHSCWMRALALPELLMRAFKTVSGSRACCPPKVTVFSLVEKLWVSSAPTAVLVNSLTLW